MLLLWPTAAFVAVFVLLPTQRQLLLPSDAFVLSSNPTTTKCHRIRQPGVPASNSPARRGIVLHAGRNSNEINQSGSSSPLPSPFFNVRVEFEGHTCDIKVHEGETLLAALERENVSQRLALPFSMIPHDCRRGNCLTCTAKHATTSQMSSLVPPARKVSSSPSTSSLKRTTKNPRNTRPDSDGLSPYMSEQIYDLGYVLTCSSQVVGDGLHIILCENDQIWTDMYQQRFLQDKTLEVEAWAAMARQRRLGDERNIARWTKETETVLYRDHDEAA